VKVPEERKMPGKFPEPILSAHKYGGGGKKQARFPLLRCLDVYVDTDILMTCNLIIISGYGLKQVALTIPLISAGIKTTLYKSQNPNFDFSFISKDNIF